MSSILHPTHVSTTVASCLILIWPLQLGLDVRVGAVAHHWDRESDDGRRFGLLVRPAGAEGRVVVGHVALVGEGGAGEGNDG